MPAGKSRRQCLVENRIRREVAPVLLERVLKLAWIKGKYIRAGQFVGVLSGVTIGRPTKEELGVRSLGL